MKQSMSISAGKRAGHKHNVEEEYRRGLANVVSERTELNQILIDVSLEQIYESEFGDALAEYNAKQIEKGHAERAIKNYLEKISESKQEKPAYELVLQLGNRDTNSAAEEVNRLGSSQIYREWLAWFHRELPQFKVHQAVIHMDEATPHLHVAYVPVSTGNKRGLSVKNSLSGAMKQMGYTDIRAVNERMFEQFERIAERHGIERVDMGCERAHLDVRDFKQMQAEIEAGREYPYRNDPELIKLLDEQVKAHEDLANETKEKVLVPLENLTNKRITPLSIFSVVNELKEICQAANALYEHHNQAATRGRSFLAAVPAFWRDHIINPITDKLNELRERYSASEDVVEHVEQPVEPGPEYSGSIFDFGDELIDISRAANAAHTQRGHVSRDYER